MRSIYEYEKLERVKPIVDHGIKALSPFISRHGALTLALSLLGGLGLPLLLSGLTLEIEKERTAEDAAIAGLFFPR